MAWAFFIACDDARIEATGKTSFMGVYGGEIFVPSLPARIDKLLLMVRVRTRLDEPRSLTRIRVQVPGSTEALTFPAAAPAMTEEMSARLMEDGAQFFETSQMIQMISVEISEEGRMKIWADLDDGEEVYAGSMKIRLAEQALINLSPDMIVFATAYYAQRALALGEDAGGLAKELMDAIAHSIPQSLVQQTDRHDSLIIQIQKNFFHVVFGHPYSKPPRIKLRLEPETLSYEIREVTRFGFVAQVSPENSPVGSFAFDALTD